MNEIKQQRKKEIGKRIRELRIQKKMTQEQLAKAVGYTSVNSKSTINKIEQGKNDIAQSKLKDYAKVLDVSIGYLLGVEDNLEDKTYILHDFMMDIKNMDRIQKENNDINNEMLKTFLNDETYKLLKNYISLNEIGRQKVLSLAKDLNEIEKYKK